MDSPLYAEAVLVEDGTIVQVGKRDALLQCITAQTNIVNLNGAALLPGFIDPHSHFVSVAESLGTAQLGKCKNFGEIVDKLREFKTLHKLEDSDWVVGSGYDHNQLEEKCHPDKSLLDLALPGCRVLISHASGHMGVLSSDALQAAHITHTTPDPDGGKIGRIPGTTQPNGYLEETAYFEASAVVDPPDEEQLLAQMDMAQQIYARNGITTVQDGFTGEKQWALLRKFSDSGVMKLDTVCYIDPKKAKHLAQENLSRVQRYKRHLKIGGYKLFFDGSPQGRTAWMTKPYLNGETGYCGYPIYSDEEAQYLIFEAMNDHMQVLVHCNGDAACEQMVSICERITENKDVGLRPVMVHAQFARDDHLQRMAQLGIIPSFFVAHTYFWGDTHIHNLGEERAMHISPAQSAKGYGLPFTFHQDSPVLPPNMLITLWCAVNRLTRSGIVLGEEEQISTLDALRAVTQNAAYQYFEEDQKGTIAVGKQADFVMLDHNPLRVRPMDLKRIRVLKTFKNDEVVYERE